MARMAPRRTANWFDRMAGEPARPYRGKHEKHTFRRWLAGFFGGWAVVFLIGLLIMEGIA